MHRTLQETDWEWLIQRIRKGRCTPFLGAGAAHGVLPLAVQVAQDWAKSYGYPLDDKTDLLRVAQFLAVSRFAMFPKDIITEQFKGVAPPDFKSPDEPHAILADLPLPIYITTNYDDFMVQALRDRGKDPIREVCRWNTVLKELPPAFGGESGLQPTPDTPVVYHLHGHTEIPESLVLTEDDYLDLLVKISRDEDLLPPLIQKALTGASLLFIGYRIADWDFRVLFRSLVTYLERSITHAHVSVQVLPLGDEATEDQQEDARKFLDKYFDKLETRMYWGTSHQFTLELRERWKKS
jgi:hypothetical protein